MMIKEKKFVLDITVEGIHLHDEFIGISLPSAVYNFLLKYPQLKDYEEAHISQHITKQDLNVEVYE